MPESTKSSLRIAIVGAGPVGLTAAILLKIKGLDAVVYERHETTAQLPQAHVVNTRTSEIFREMGTFDALDAVASDEQRLNCITWSSSLSGTRFGRLPVKGNAEQKAYRRAVSPVRSLNVGQNLVERVLLERLRQLGGDVLFCHAVSSARQVGSRATLTVRDPAGQETERVFDYVLACDGAGSTVRNALGIEMVGPPSLARFASCYFQADLNRYLGADTGPVHFIAGDDFSAALISFDLKQTWALMTTMAPSARREDFSRELMGDLIRRAVGDPHVRFEIQSVGAWNMSAQVATAFRQGPFFLVGDAAHRFPPTGGLGLNTGVQDAHNLAWKLDFVARGESPVSLLDTYASERAPVAVRNCAHSVDNAMKMAEVDLAVGASFFAPVIPAVVRREVTPERDHGLTGDSPEAVSKRLRIQIAIDRQRPHFDALRMEIGYRYGEEDPAPGQPVDDDHRAAVAVGARLPHAWLPAQPNRSTMDAYDRGAFTLLVSDDASAWAPHAEALRLAGVSIASGLPDWHAVLVRPDGHVQWQGEQASEEAVADLIGTVSELKSGRIPKGLPNQINRNENVTFMQTKSKTILGVPMDTIRPSKLAHVVLRTDERFEEVCQWYQDVLNARVLHKDPMICFMTYDDEHHRMAIARVPGMVARPSGTVGLEHVAFTYESLADLLETYVRLKDKGIAPILTINHGGTTSFYYEDPDRNRIELQIDNFDTIGEFMAFMRTGVMAVNPIGLAFDAEEMLARFRAGASPKTLVAYPLQPDPVDPRVMQRLLQN